MKHPYPTEQLTEFRQSGFTLTITLAGMLAFLVLAADYLTGATIRFPLLYALPVGIVAWRRRKGVAYSLAVILPLTRLFFHYLWHGTIVEVAVWGNTVIDVGALLFYTYLIDRVAWQNEALQREVRILTGILPICASCKKVRNEDGEYEPVEKYISEHSAATFSHGLCLDCAQKLYPEVFSSRRGHSPQQ